MIDGIEKGNSMKEKTFYIVNAAAWTLLVLASIDPLSRMITEPWQLWITLLVVLGIMYLVWYSLKMTERRNNGKGKN